MPAVFLGWVTVSQLVTLETGIGVDYMKSTKILNTKLRPLAWEAWAQRQRREWRDSDSLAGAALPSLGVAHL